MDAAEQLLAIEAIKITKARYFRFMDTKQWDLLPSVFADDLKIILPDGRVWLEGGQAFADSLRFGLESGVSQHLGFMGEIELIDADDPEKISAKGIWAMEDVIHWPDKHPREGWKAIHGRGHYHDTYRRIDGSWKIATLMLTRISLDITWPDSGPEDESRAA